MVRVGWVLISFIGCDLKIFFALRSVSQTLRWLPLGPHPRIQNPGTPTPKTWSPHTRTPTKFDKTGTRNWGSHGGPGGRPQDPLGPPISGPVGVGVQNPKFRGFGGSPGGTPGDPPKPRNLGVWEVQIWGVPGGSNFGFSGGPGGTPGNPRKPEIWVPGPSKRVQTTLSKAD